MLIDYSNKIEKMNSGVGIIFFSERTGAFTKSKASLLYNYQFKLNSKGKLSLGTTLNYKRENVNFSESVIIIDSGDPVIMEDNSSRSNFDLGVLYQIKDMYISVGLNNVLQSDYSSSDGWRASNTRTFNAYVMNEFRFNKWLAFTPSLLYVTDFQGRWRLDVNALFELQKWILMGATFRTEGNDFFGIYNVGLNIKDKVQIISRVYNGDNQSRYSDNSLELMIKVKISNE